MQEVLKLSWKSSTKLLIHFGDAPAHGSQYHNGRASDKYAAGDPHGEIGDLHLNKTVLPGSCQGVACAVLAGALQHSQID